MSHKKIGLKADIVPKVSVLPEPRVVIEDDEDEPEDEEIIDEPEDESEHDETDDENAELDRIAEKEFARIDEENSARIAQIQEQQKLVTASNKTKATSVDIQPMPLSTKRKPRTKKTYPPSESMFKELIKAMCEQRDATRKVITLARETEKCTNNEMKSLKAIVKKQKGDKPRRKPRGFALPSLISQEMVDYLLNEAKITYIDRKVSGQVVGQIKIETGCSLARNELTAALCQHFATHGMRKNEQDKRKIYLDKATTVLFGIDRDQFTKDGGQLSLQGEVIITYFELQKYLPRHCGKKALGH